MSDKKITIISNTTGELLIKMPEFNFKRSLPGKGSKMTVDKEILEEMMYDPGVRYCFDNGMIYIEDMEIKKEIGLEPEDAEQPVNIIILTDKQREEWLSNTKPVWQFKELIDSLGYEERQNLAYYAIEHEILPSIDKCDYIKQNCGKDIIKAIELKRLNSDKEE